VQKLLTAMLAALIVTGCAAQSPTTTAYVEPPEDAKTPRREITLEEKKFLIEALSRDLKDPGSAQFRWAQIPVPSTPTGAVHYCATVNAKNSYGGYVGQKPFIAVIGFVNNKMSMAGMVALSGSDEYQDQPISALCTKYNLSPFGAV